MSGQRSEQRADEGVLTAGKPDRLTGQTLIWAVRIRSFNQAEVEAKLAQADLLDGEADKIVMRCASCALKMDGSSDHALKVLDYTLYFCTERCAKSFAENTTKAVLALEIPEG